ncbi:MAG: hypothetical protein A2Z11_02365 [Candidatus Woykebacteria bacterium RBG_16_43_9]|uniref:Bacterial Ig-like domain-containing protein n=1 Tax=Candidatus Woykebacteria bacterium RBG_16_43_9 TaxID=1802596 RepID=A0A1G1WH74_9BACT|nr:MAG: hypothetical protein A2Z11_02365 [Candidatus Woykebacteria bacterium RBG_16_43_9]
MKPVHDFLIIVAILGIISGTAGSIIYAFNKNLSENSNLQRFPLVAEQDLNKAGKVLMGQQNCNDITIGNNTIAPYQDFGNTSLSSIDVCFINWNPSSYTLIDENGHSSIPIASNSSENRTLTTGVYCYYLQSNHSAHVYVKVGQNQSCSWEQEANSSTNTNNSTTVSVVETLKTIKLPNVFKGKTTNLSKVSDLSKVKGFILDAPKKGKITFTDTLNLSSTTLVALFKKLDKYVKITKKGVVEINSKVLSVFAKKKAAVSMFDLPFIETPDLYVDGEKATEKQVSDVKYGKGVLSFNVSGFSKYEAVPKLEIIEPKNGFTTKKSSITLKGKIGDPTASVSATLNNKVLGNLKVATKSGEFNKALTLSTGKNNIVIKAASGLGQKLEASISGVFTPEAKKEVGGFFSRQLFGLIVLALILISMGVAWWYYKKKDQRNLS